MVIKIKLEYIDDVIHENRSYVKEERKDERNYLYRSIDEKANTHQRVVLVKEIEEKKSHYTRIYISLDKKNGIRSSVNIRE